MSTVLGLDEVTGLSDDIVEIIRELAVRAYENNKDLVEIKFVRSTKHGDKLIGLPSQVSTPAGYVKVVVWL